MASFHELTQSRQLKLGTYIGEFATPGIGQILKASGCEYAFVDMEHSGFTFETVKAVLRNLHDAGIATAVRPPSAAAQAKRARRSDTSDRRPQPLRRKRGLLRRFVRRRARTR